MTTWLQDTRANLCVLLVTVPFYASAQSLKVSPEAFAGTAWTARIELDARPPLQVNSAFTAEKTGGQRLHFYGDYQFSDWRLGNGTGLRLTSETDKHWIVEAGAGVAWHELVAWTLDHGYPGLENMALIPGTVGASPVQNVGAYGVELQDRFESLDAIDLQTGKVFTLNAAQCAFGYRDSVFKHLPAAPGMGLAGKLEPVRGKHETAAGRLGR